VSYFAPVFRDGPFVHASLTQLRAHDPALLVQQQAAGLRPAGVRFYVSVGGNHGAARASWTVDFARELTQLRLQHELWQLPPIDRGRFWGATPLRGALRMQHLEARMTESRKGDVIAVNRAARIMAALAELDDQ
jgi:hypothetical protein